MNTKEYFRNRLQETYIAGVGHQVGDICYSNEELISQFDLNIKPSFIDKSIGIKTRYFASANQASSDLATVAAQKALAMAEVSIHEVDRLIVATSTPDHLTPSTACIVQFKLGGKNFPASDIVSACSGFLYGLDQALRAMATGDETILLIGVDCRSRTLNFKDKRTVFLYGDGAGAIVLKRKPASSNGFMDISLMADGIGHNAVCVPAGGSRTPCTVENVSNNLHKLSMPDGSFVAKNALLGFESLIREMLNKHSLTINDIDQYILHQPNYRLLETVLKTLGIKEQQTYINFPDYGNTVAGSIPIALSEAIEKGKINHGDLVLLCGVGGGFTGGAALLRWGE